MEERVLYYNGRIFTMDDQCPMAEFVLTEGEQIVDLGGSENQKQYEGSGIKKIDLKGKTMLPGFIDSHLHMLTAALNRLKLDLSGMQFGTIDDMLDYIRSEKEGCGEEWICAFGFSEENIGEGRTVTRQDLDRFFPNCPVTVIRVCGHMCIVNSQAISRLDQEKMERIVGGEFLKDEKGDYTGLATEGAQQYVLDSMPPADREVVLRYMEQEQEILVQQGITAIHDAGTDMMPPRDYVEIFQEMDRRKKLKLRTYLMVRPQDEEPVEEFLRYLEGEKACTQGGRLTIGSVKLFADGSFGSRTAAVKEPYEQEEGNFGLLLESRLDQYVEPIASEGQQVAVHAIGDRASGYVADQYCRAQRKEGRQRLEHAELLDDELLETFRKNHILVMTQPIFLWEFGNTYFRNLGPERAMRIQPIRTMLEKGILVGFGTDYPVDDPNPLLGIQAAMTRRAKNSNQVLNTEETISFLEAVKCYTLNNAYGAFAEKTTGSIEKGKAADFVILEGIHPEEDGQVRRLDEAVVSQTIIGGKVVYSREE